MTTPSYPFNSRFRLLVEEQSDWWYLINASGEASPEAFSKAFEDAAYSKEQVSGFLKALKEKPIDELVHLALKDDSDESPALIVLQQAKSRDVFDKAIQLCASENPKERVLGVEIMMRQPGLTFNSEAVEKMCNLAELETHAEVLEVLAYALCHLDIDHRSQYLQHPATSPAAKTRKAAAYSLCQLHDELAVGLLLGLSADDDGDVRNWATFGLQPMYRERQDRQEIRDALFARIHDSHDEARHEALVGLAQYKDERVIGPLIEALCAETVWELAVEAAEEIGHAELYPHLVNLRAWWDINPELLERAVVACGATGETCSE